MQITMLKSKIHRVVITGTDLDYEGSISIDKDLMKAARILPFEMVAVLNLNNGERFETYAIEDRAGTGNVRLNGPAARLGQKGDLVIILSYATMSDEETVSFKPCVVNVDSRNKFV
jgi:aspartate 1-decarboxylase